MNIAAGQDSRLRVHGLFGLKGNRGIAKKKRNSVIGSSSPFC
jgi:hypothetical protein